MLLFLDSIILHPVPGEAVVGEGDVGVLGLLETPQSPEEMRGETEDGHLQQDLLH